MSRDKTVPVFIAVCAFFVLNRLLVQLMKLPRLVPEVLGLGYYVVLVIISLVLGYLLYGERLQNWLKRPDCPSKDKWLSLLITVVLFLGLGKLLLWLLEVLPPHIWGRHLPRILRQPRRLRHAHRWGHSPPGREPHPRRQALFPPHQELARTVKNKKERGDPLFFIARPRPARKHAP